MKPFPPNDDASRERSRAARDAERLRDLLSMSDEDRRDFLALLDSRDRGEWLAIWRAYEEIERH